MGTHTPGPWRLAGGMVDGYAVIGADQTVVIAAVPSNTDAHLIAKAPLMLGLLKLASLELEGTLVDEINALLRDVEGGSNG